MEKIYNTLREMKLSLCIVIIVMLQHTIIIEYDASIASYVKVLHS